jgi:beta-lactamase regulating signal transducer with metallopeptidase domain
MLLNLDGTLAVLARPVVMTLLHFLWQGSLVALGLAAVLGLLQRRSAAARYICACTALGLMIALPVITFLNLPDDTSGTVRTLVAPASAAATVPAATPGIAPEDATATGAPALAEAGDGRAGFWWRHRRTLEAASPWIFLAWLSGVLALAAWNLVGWGRTRRWTHHGVEPVSEAWRRRVAGLCARLGIRRAVRVMASTLVEVPSVVGWLRPVVLVPMAALSGLPPDQLEIVLVHELAHIRRGDYLVNLLQVVAETLLFYHPAVWWVSAQLRRERENCCDDMAVAVGGDRLAYARALLGLEELRIVRPRLALGATDGSLVHRIRRLAGGAAMNHDHIAWSRLAGSLLAGLLLIGGVALVLAAQGLTLGTDASPLAGGEPITVAARTEVQNDARDRDDHAAITGDWELQRRNGRYRLRLEIGSGRRHSSMDFRLSDDEQTAVREAKGNAVTLKRDAGTFRLAFDDDRRGGGEFTFQPDARTMKRFAELGVQGLTDRQAFHLACSDVDVRWVEELHDLGYKDVDAEELVALGIHRVTPEFIREIAALGYEKLDLDQLLAMRIHDVTPEFVKQMAEAGYAHLPADQLLAWRIHDVTPEFVKQMAEAGYAHVSADQLVAWRIHDVDPDYVKELAELGYRDLDADQLTAWRIHDVSPHFVREMEELGISGLHGDDLVAMRIHDVDPSFVKELQELGYDHLNADRLVAMRIHDVTARYIRELARLGYEHVPVDDLIAMQIHDVTISFIEKLQAKGIKHLDPDDLVTLKIHDIEL